MATSADAVNCKAVGVVVQAGSGRLGLVRHRMDHVADLRFAEKLFLTALGSVLDFWSSSDWHARQRMCMYAPLGYRGPLREVVHFDLFSP